MKTKTIFVTLSEEEMDVFRKFAKLSGIPMHEMVRRIIRLWLGRRDVQAIARRVEKRFLAEKNDELL